MKINQIMKKQGNQTSRPASDFATRLWAKVLLRTAPRLHERPSFFASGVASFSRGEKETSFRGSGAAGRHNFRCRWCSVWARVFSAAGTAEGDLGVACTLLTAASSASSLLSCGVGVEGVANGVAPTNGDCDVASRGGVDGGAVSTNEGCGAVGRGGVEGAVTCVAATNNALSMAVKRFHRRRAIAAGIGSAGFGIDACGVFLRIMPHNAP